jgi:DegV family protein with EDD domain
MREVNGLYLTQINIIYPVGENMSSVAIVTDSTAYLPNDLLKKYSIATVPLILIWGDQTYEDGVTLMPDEFYRRLPDAKVMPTTSQATIPSMQKAFSTFIDQGYDVLGIFLSSKLSGTVQSAMQAREMMGTAAEKIAIVDSLATTMAMGWPVLTAARAAEAGQNLAECIKIAEHARDQTGVLFVVETLEFLRRGGRIGGAQALLGTALNIKPILELQDGRIESVEKIRTKGKALERMLDLAEEKMAGRTPVRLATVHANAEQAALDLLETAKARFNPVESIHSILSPVIGAHAGPGTVALAYMTEI